MTKPGWWATIPPHKRLLLWVLVTIDRIPRPTTLYRWDRDAEDKDDRFTKLPRRWMRGWWGLNFAVDRGWLDRYPYHFFSPEDVERRETKEEEA